MSEDPEKIKLDSPKSQIRIIPSSTSNLHLQPKKDETIQQPPPAPPPPSHPLFFFENSEFGAGDLGASMERLSSQLSSSDRTSYMTESRPLSARQQVFQWLKRNSMVELKGLSGLKSVPALYGLTGGGGGAHGAGGQGQDSISRGVSMRRGRRPKKAASCHSGGARSSMTGMSNQSLNNYNFQAHRKSRSHASRLTMMSHHHQAGGGQRCNGGHGNHHHLGLGPNSLGPGDSPFFFRHVHSQATVRHFEPDSTRSSMRRSGGGYNNQEHKSVSRMASSARIQPIKPINRLRDSCVTLCSNCKSYTSLNRSNAPGSAAATRRSSAQQSQISLSHVGSFRGGAGGATMAMGSALSSRIASAVAVSEQPELQPVNEEGGPIMITTNRTESLAGEDIEVSPCKICLTDITSDESYTFVECGCVFCKDCAEQYIEFEIMQGAYDIACPDPDCAKKGVVTMEEMENLVGTEMTKKHESFRLNLEVSLDDKRTWCPSANCGTVCHVCPTEDEKTPASAECPKCEKTFCSQCQGEWHPGKTCRQYGSDLVTQRAGKKITSTWLFGGGGTSDIGGIGGLGLMGNAGGFSNNGEVNVNGVDIKQCPVCGIPIQKEEGCAQMMCSRCKHVFCWFCLESLEDDFLLRHFDSGNCKGRLGHSRLSVLWHRVQVVAIFAMFGLLLLIASPILLIVAPCVLCFRCKVAKRGDKRMDDVENGTHSEDEDDSDFADDEDDEETQEEEPQSRDQLLPAVSEIDTNKNEETKNPSVMDENRQDEETENLDPPDETQKLNTIEEDKVVN